MRFWRYSLSFLLVAGAVGSSASAQEPTVSVEELAPNVYLFTHNAHRSLFVATEDGVIATDPQSTEAAPRYLEEIRKITDAPIRYLVYSHHHDDHVSGGAAFGDVEIIAHEAVEGHIQGDIAPPTRTFSERASLYLGDLEVRLIYPGPSETASNIIVHVPARGVAFMVDAVSVRTVPWRDMAGSRPDEWIAALEALNALDFEILAPGHGPTGTKAHVSEYITYMNDLVAAVREAMERGETLEQMKESLELPQYQDWTRYDEHFDLNIEGIHRELSP